MRRSVSAWLAGRTQLLVTRRHALARGGLDHDGSAATGGQGAVHRRIELRRRPARAASTDFARHESTGAVLIAATPYRGPRTAVLRGPHDRSDCGLLDAVGPPLGEDDAGTDRCAAAQRLATSQPVLSRTHVDARARGGGATSHGRSPQGSL